MKTSTFGMPLNLLCIIALMFACFILFALRCTVGLAYTCTSFAWSNANQVYATHPVTSTLLRSVAPDWSLDKRAEEKLRFFYVRSTGAQGEVSLHSDKWVIAYFESPDSMPVLYDMHARRLGDADIQKNLNPIFALTVNGARRVIGAGTHAAMLCSLKNILEIRDVSC